MATLLEKPIRVPAKTDVVPPLENGDRLTRAEFERRYSAMPHETRAELLEGVVYMPSPVSLLNHGEPHVNITAWLGIYKMRTPGVRCGDNCTVRLDMGSEPQPDAVLLI